MAFFGGTVNPIQHLLDEHKLIMAEVAQLRQAVSDLATRGQAALPEALPVLRRIGRLMETRLAQHARKEDAVLFPAMEAVIGAESGPTQVMRWEHKAIHEQGALLRRTLSELNDVEHPKIESGGARLRELAADGRDAEALRVTADEIIRLLDAHFAKEEQILFPMAETILDPAAIEAISRGLEAIG
jgi:hemerythrin-like domain-containing protein